MRLDFVRLACLHIDSRSRLETTLNADWLRERSYPSKADHVGKHILRGAKPSRDTNTNYRGA